MIGAETLVVALADFGQDVDPISRLDAVVGLDVEGPLVLDHLEHLHRNRTGKP